MNAALPAPRLRAPLAHEAIADHLRRRILAHELAPGAAIDEAALASSYGVMRAAVREALNLLFGEGLVACGEATVGPAAAMTEGPSAGMTAGITAGMTVVRLAEAEGREALALRDLLRARLADRRGLPGGGGPRDGGGETLRQLVDLAERRVLLALGPRAYE